MDDYNVSPFNRVPAVVLIIAAAIMGVELVLTAANFGMIGGADGVGWRLRAFQNWSFISEIWNSMLVNRRFPAEDVARLFTYPFIHARFFDAAFATALFIALGKGVSDNLTPWAVVIIFVTSSVCGAIAYGSLVETRVPLSSAFTVNFGLIGAITYIRMLDLKSAGKSQIMAFRLIGMFMVLRLVWGILSMVRGTQQDMQWISELTGFAVGFLATALLEPTGWPKLIALLRRR